MSDDGSVIFVSTDSEQWDMSYGVDETGWQGRSIPNSSIGGSKLRTPSSSTGTCRASKGGIHHRLRRAAAAAAARVVSCVRRQDEGDNDDKEFPTVGTISIVRPATAARALRARRVYVRHRHNLTFMRLTLMQKPETELGGADHSTRRRVIKTTIVLIEYEEAEAEAEAVRSRHADDKPTTPDFDAGARDHFAMGVATELGMLCDDVRETGARTHSVIVETSVTVDGGAEASAAFTSSLTDPAKLLEFLFEPCATSGVHIKELAAEEAPEPAAPEPALPPAPVVTDNGPLLTLIGVTFGSNSNGMIGGDFHAERSVSTDVLTRREESPSPPAPDVASATGHTSSSRDLPIFRCVASPLFFCHPYPVHRRVITAFFLVAEVPGLRRAQAVLFARLPLGCLVLDV